MCDEQRLGVEEGELYFWAEEQNCEVTEIQQRMCSLEEEEEEIKAGEFSSRRKKGPCTHGLFSVMLLETDAGEVPMIANGDFFSFIYVNGYFDEMRMVTRDM